MFGASVFFSSSLTAAILHLLKFSSTNSGKESKVQEQAKDSNYQMELLHMGSISVMVNMNLRKIKSVLLLSYQIFKIEQLSNIGTGWQRCFISAYTSDVEDKEAYFSPVGVEKGSVTIPWTIPVVLCCWNIELFHWGILSSTSVDLDCLGFPLRSMLWETPICHCLFYTKEVI